MKILFQWKYSLLVLVVQRTFFPQKNRFDQFFNQKNAKGIYEAEVVILDENDTVWTDVRHMHMREAIDKLMADFNKFLQEHTSFRR